MAEVLVDVEKLIKSLIVLAHVIHVDETSSNINGAPGGGCTSPSPRSSPPTTCTPPAAGRRWLSSTCCLVRRTVVHDALSVYDVYSGARHALCGAHLSRELVAAAEADLDQAWPEQALRALHGLNTAATTPATSTYRIWASVSLTRSTLVKARG